MTLWPGRPGAQWGGRSHWLEPSLCRSTGKGLPGSGPRRQAAGVTHKSSRHDAGHYLPSQPHAEPFCQKIPCTPACAGQVISPVLRPTIQPLHGVPLPPQLPNYEAQRLGPARFGYVVQAWPTRPPPAPAHHQGLCSGNIRKNSVGFALLMGCSLGLLLPTGTVWGSLPEKEANTGKEHKERERERPGPRVLAGALEPQTFPCCAWNSGAGFWEGPSPPPIQELSPNPSVQFLNPTCSPPLSFSASLVLSARIPSPMVSQQPSISGLWTDHRRVLSASALAPAILRAALSVLCQVRTGSGLCP